MAVPPPASHSKSALRATLRARRAAHVDALGPSGRIAAEQRVATTLAAELAGCGPVAAYLPHGAEMGLGALVARLQAAGTATGLPVVLNRSGEMRIARWRSGEPLIAGLLGLSEPVGDAPDLEPAVILAPLVGFDRSGRRLGQGGGYYDRLFTRFPDARRIGIAWSVQGVREVPVDGWDQPLHAIATEAEWIAII